MKEQLGGGGGGEVPNRRHYTDQSVVKDYVQLPRRQIILTMTGVMLAIFLATLSQTSLATVIPNIIADLGGFDHYTWVSTAYMVTFTVVTPIVGRLIDIYGYKVFFIFGIAIFMLGSLAVGLSQSMIELIAFRSVQGIGGGIIVTSGFVTIANLFPPEKRAKFHGLLGSVYGAASLIGPTMGGVITDAFSWNWIFLMNIPAGIPVLLIGMNFPAIISEVEDRKLDYLGMFTLILAVMPILLALSFGGSQYEWGSPQVLGFLLFGLAMAMAFLVVESRCESPIMPLEIYGKRIVVVSVIVTFCVGFGLYGTVIFIPLFLQGVLGVSAIISGSFLTSMMLGIVFGGIISGQLLSRASGHGHYRIQSLISMSVMAVSMYLITTMDKDTSFILVAGYIATMGFGLGITINTLTVIVQNSVNFVGVATSALQFYRLLGGTLGLAVLGVVMTNRFSSKIDWVISDSVMLSPGRLETIKDNPKILINPDEMNALRAELGEMDFKGIQLANHIFDSLKYALSEAIGDVFSVCAVLIALSLGVVLFLRTTVSTTCVQPSKNISNKSSRGTG